MMSLRFDRLTAGLVIWLFTLYGLAPSAFAAADPEVWRRQVIYLVMPDRFHNGNIENDTLGVLECYDSGRPDKFHGGDLAGLRQKLEYLRALGVTAIWITPVYKQVASVKALGHSQYGDCGYHGYWADFTDPPVVELEPKLGTAADLSALIANAHAQKMKLILDMVVNHAGYGSDIVKRHPDWFHQADTCASLGDLDIFCPLADLPDFKQELEDGVVADYLVKESAGWVRRFPIDGIRMDTASHVPPWFYRDRWIPAMGSIRSGLFLLAEGSPGRSILQLRPFITEQGFDSVFNFPLRQALVTAFAKGESVDVVADTVQQTIATFGPDQTTMLVNLLDNHDVPRFVSEPGRDVADDEIRRRYHLALAAIFTLPGIPQLYYGDELGLDGRADPDNRRDMPNWAWTRSGRSQPHPDEALSPSESTFSHVQRLIEIRKGNPALYRGYYAEMWRQGGGVGHNVYAFFRGDGDNRIITVLNNGDSPSAVLSMPVRTNGAIAGKDRGTLADGTVFDELLNDRVPSIVTLSDGQLTVDVQTKAAMIYRPRSSRGACAVTFHVTATTAFGENLYLSGNAQELGSWDTRLAVRMKPLRCAGSRCTWSVTLRYLPHGKSVKFKFLRKSDTAITFEGGTDQLLSVPSTRALVHDSGEWRD